MNRQTTISMLAALLLLTGIVACKSSGGLAGEASCEGVTCTMQFAAVTVAIHDAKGYPAALDSVVTFNAAGARVRKSRGNASGIYAILDDSYRKALTNRKETFSVRGYRRGRELVRESFSLGADCCHVRKISGPEVLSLKL
jgi:hypothetical protein